MFIMLLLCGAEELTTPLSEEVVRVVGGKESTRSQLSGRRGGQIWLIISFVCRV